MTEDEAYYELVRHYLPYYYGNDLNGLLAGFIARMKEKGYSPEFCARHLYQALTDPLDRLLTIGE